MKVLIALSALVAASYAIAEYEPCSPPSSLHHLGVVHNHGQCDEGLECRSVMIPGGKMGNSVCVRKERMISKRMTHCPPDACSQVEFKEMTCDGGKIDGWCGCTQHCAKVLGEECVPPRFGPPNLKACDTGLVCKTLPEGSRCIDAANADTYVS